MELMDGNGDFTQPKDTDSRSAIPVLSKYHCVVYCVTSTAETQHNVRSRASALPAAV